MDRKEAKAMLPIIKAYAEGKTIQCLIGDKWEDVTDSIKLYFIDPPSCYRIKPEPKYRPFKTSEECWNEMHKHSDFGWVSDGYYKSTISVKSNSIVITISSDEYSFTSAFQSLTFVDGTPFGIKEE